MKFRSTAILLVIAAALLVYFFAIEQPGHKQKIEQENLHQKLTTLKMENIMHVTVDAPGRRRLEFARQGGKWMMLSPVHDIADAATVNTLISSTMSADIERRLKPDSIPLSNFGLDTSAVVVEFSSAHNDTNLLLRVGLHNLTKSHFYAQKDTSREILLLPATIRRYAVKEANDFRDKKVIDFQVADVKKYEIASGKKSMIWQETGQSKWINTQGADTIRGDKYNVESILHEFRGLRVKSFVSDNPDSFKYYESPDKRSLTIWTGDDMAKKTLFCGKLDKDQFFAKRASKDRIVKLDGSFLEIFSKTLSDLREKRLLFFKRSELSKITLQTPDTSITIIKMGSDWAFPNPTLGGIEQSKVTSLLSKLESLKFDKAVKEHISGMSGYGLSQPSFRITLFGEGDHRIDEVLSGEEEPKSKKLYVTSRSSGLLALIDASALEKLLEDCKSLKKL